MSKLIKLLKIQINKWRLRSLSFSKVKISKKFLTTVIEATVFIRRRGVSLWIIYHCNILLQLHVKLKIIHIRSGHLKLHVTMCLYPYSPPSVPLRYFDFTDPGCRVEVRWRDSTAQQKRVEGQTTGVDMGRQLIRSSLCPSKHRGGDLCCQLFYRNFLMFFERLVFSGMDKTRRGQGTDTHMDTHPTHTHTNPNTRTHSHV